MSCTYFYYCFFNLFRYQTENRCFAAADLPRPRKHDGQILATPQARMVVRGIQKTWRFQVKMNRLSVQTVWLQLLFLTNCCWNDKLSNFSRCETALPVSTTAGPEGNVESEAFGQLFWGWKMKWLMLTARFLAGFFVITMWSFLVFLSTAQFYSLDLFGQCIFHLVAKIRVEDIRQREGEEEQETKLQVGMGSLGEPVVPQYDFGDLHLKCELFKVAQIYPKFQLFHVSSCCFVIR